MTNLVGDVSDSGRFQIRGVGIPYTGVTYTTREAAEEAASVFRDHMIDAEVVPIDNPKFPTPWRADDGGYVYDANGVRVVDTVFMGTGGFAGDLARLIADAVNEKYGKPSPVAEGDEPKPGDRVRVVECCPGNPLDACGYVVGSEGTLVNVTSTRRYLIRTDSGGAGVYYKVAKV